MGQKKGFQGNAWEAIENYIKDNKDEENKKSTPSNNPYLARYKNHFWNSTSIKTAYGNTQAIKASLSVLKKQLPEQFHPLIRFSQIDHTWQLNVAKGVTANQLNLLLDDLSLKIAKQIGYSPAIKVNVTPGHWAQSGLPLTKQKKLDKGMPTLDEADDFIQKFLRS